MSIFGAGKVIIQKITEKDLQTFLVGFDYDDYGVRKYRWASLINILQNALPEFAFGFHEGESVAVSKIMNLISDAAKSIYKIDEFKKAKKIYVDENYYIPDDDIESKYLKKGEFGELILHLLLRDFFGTIPLLSKIYFKDSYGMTVHGFDAVHIQPSSKTLWLGESKLYIDGKKGVEALIDDINNHFNKDYLDQEFALISKKVKHLPDTHIPEKQYWLGLMDKNTTLREVFSNINIPLICTYSSSAFREYDDETNLDFLQFYNDEIRSLQQHFMEKNNHPNKANLNIILLLFPVQDKNTLVKRMHKKLIRLQEIDSDEE